MGPLLRLIGTFDYHRLKEEGSNKYDGNEEHIFQEQSCFLKVMIYLNLTTH